MAIDLQTVLWSTDDNAREITAGDRRHTDCKCRRARVDILVVRGVDADRRDADEVAVLGHPRQRDGFLLENFGHGAGSVVLPYFARRRIRRRRWLAGGHGRSRNSEFAPCAKSLGITVVRHNLVLGYLVQRVVSPD